MVMMFVFKHSFKSGLVGLLALQGVVATAQTAPVAAPEVSTSVGTASEPGWFSRTWTTARDGTVNIVQNGGWEVYLPTYTWHMPYAYTSEQRDKYNNSPWGLGIGRGQYLDNGNWNGIYAMEFKDSNSYPSWMFGYVYRWLWGGSSGLYGGVGATAFIMTRENYSHYTPFPGILPMTTIGFHNVSLEAVYVPGFKRGSGSVMLFWLKIEEKARPH